MPKIIPRTLGVAEVVACEINCELITSHVIDKISGLDEFSHDYVANKYIDTCTTDNQFVVRHFCFAINQADGTAQIVCLGDKTKDGAIPTMTITYTHIQPDYTKWEINKLAQIQTVMAVFNRILQYIRALENGHKNDVPVQGQQGIK